MATADISPISLLGRQVSFRDLHFEQILRDMTLPPDYPEELLSSVKTGQVTEFCIRMRLKGEDGWEVVSEILVDDTYYDLSECDFLNLNLRREL